MSYQQFLQQLIGVTLIMLFLVGCGAPAATSVSEAPTAIPTPEPATQTPTDTPEPPTQTPTPTPTDTPEPPTQTPTPTPTDTPELPTPTPTPTDTPEPPTQTPTPTPTVTPELPTPTPTDTPTSTDTLIPTPQPNVSFDSNVGAEFTGVTISFQHPREWQIGYFSDSGAYGWVIADADPNQVFWSANQTGNEVVIILTGGIEADSDSDPSKMLEQIGRGPISTDINQFKEEDKQFAYVLNSGEVRAAAIIQQKIFFLFGTYPKEKESAVQNGIEIILHSLMLHDATGKDFSNETIWGTRNEGLLITGTTRDGYIPVSSMSIWTIEVKPGQEIKILVDSDDPESKILLNILGEDEKSIFSAGAISFVGKHESDQIHLPASGSYIIQLSLSPDSQWYGWYKIELK